MSLTTKDISLEQANAVIAAVIAEAGRRGCRSNVVVVDAGCHLKAVARMDGAFLGSLDVAHRKARTARLFDMPSGAIGQLSQPGGPLFGIEQSNGGLISFGGGVPLTDGDTIIGAVGVSGGSVEDDQAIAEAGAAAI